MHTYTHVHIYMLIHTQNNHTREYIDTHTETRACLYRHEHTHRLRKANTHPRTQSYAHTTRITHTHNQPPTHPPTIHPTHPPTHRDT